MTHTIKHLGGWVAGAVILFTLAGVGLLAWRVATSPAYERQAAADASVAEATAVERAATAKVAGQFERERLAQQAQIEQQQVAQWAGYAEAWINPGWAAFNGSLGWAATMTIWLGVAALVAAFVIAVDAYWLRRRPLVLPDRRGLMPIDRGQVADLTAIAIGLMEHHQHASGAATLAGARRPVLPQHYAPHISIKQDVVRPAPAVPALPAPEQVAQPIKVPTFAELLASGQIGADTPLILGFDVQTGEAITGGLNSVYSMLLGGLAGSGKTTSQRYLSSVIALKGGRFVVCDPHGDSGDESLASTLAPLSSAFLCGVAIEDNDILQAVRLVADIGERRIKGKDQSRELVMLWVDEVTSLLQKEKIRGELGGLIEEIARQYRKVNVFCSASGQNWSAARTGGNSALRESFSSVICHRLRRTSARMIVPAGDAALVEHLPPGQALLWRASGEASVVVVPNCTTRDVEGVARLVERRVPGFSDKAPSTAPSRSPSRLPSLPNQAVAIEQAFSPAPSPLSEGGKEGATEPLDPRAARVKALMLEGMTPNQIIKELWGQTAGAGYQKAAGELNEILRRLIAGAA
jgi:hypothetical protein